MPTTGTRHVVAKDHKPLQKNARVDLREPKAYSYGHTLIYTHTRIRIYVSKVNFYPFYFGQLWTHWFKILFQYAHSGDQIVFIELTIDELSTYTRAHEMNIVIWFILSCLLLWLLTFLFLNICCCHIPFVYVLVKFVLYLWKRNLKVTPVNYGRYFFLYKLLNHNNRPEEFHKIVLINFQVCPTLTFRKKICVSIL